MPLNPRVVDLMPFSATLQWDPPSDNGGSSLPLTYTVNLTSTSTSLPFSAITATSLPLPNLHHSTQYSWSVQAINEYGSSPPAEGTFRTNDTGQYCHLHTCMILRNHFHTRPYILMLWRLIAIYTIDIYNYSG